MKYTVLVFSLLLISFFASAQTWNELNDSLIQYYNSREYNKGVTIGEKAVIAAKKQFGETHPDYATSLNNLAALYESMGQYAKAEPLYMEAMGIRKKAWGETHPDYLTSLNNLALLYFRMGQYAKAEPLYMEAMGIRKKSLGETHPDYATSLNNLAVLYERLNQYKKAELLYIQVIVIRKKALGETDRDYLMSVVGLAILYQAMGQYENAEPLYLQVEAIKKKTVGEDHADYATSLNNLAVLYHSMGQYEKAEPLYLRAIKIQKKALGDIDPLYARSLKNLGLFYRTKGQYEKAEPLLIQASDIMKNTLGENHPFFARSLSDLAVIYESMGQFEKAELLYVRAKEIQKSVHGETNPEYVITIFNLAGIYFDTQQYEKAEELYIQAGEFWKKVLGESHPHYLSSLGRLAETYRKMKQYEKAELLYIQLNNKEKKGSDYAATLTNQAGLYKDMGQYTKAESLYIQAKEMWKESMGETHPEYAILLAYLASFLSGTGQYEKAEPLLLEISQLTLQNLLNNFTVLSEKEKGNYLASNSSLLELNNSFLYLSKNPSASILRNSFNRQLIFKSFTLAETRNVLLSAQQSSDTTVQLLLKNWQDNKKILEKQYSLPIVNRRPDLKQIEASAEQLEKELSRKSSEFLRQQKAIRISLKDVQKGLQEDQVAIEFVRFQLYRINRTDSILYAAYVLTKKDPVPVFVPLFEEKQLQQLFDSAGKTATSMVSSFYRGLEIKNKNVATLGKELYKLVWQPLEPYLKGVREISYSPAGKLYSIAFHALPIDSNTVLMDKYQLQQYTSTRQVALRNAETQNTKPKSITLFGNASFTMDSLQLVKQKANQPEKENVSTSIYTPQKRSSDNNTWSNLPGTAEEVKKIKQLFEQKKIITKSFVQTKATEENLKALSGNSPQILHIATHGFFLPEPDKKRKENNFNNENTYTLADDPLLRSGLILSGGNYAWSGKTPIDGVEDGIATAYEISQLNLSNTELVVLSACETALGDVKGSEGVFGLQRAFKMAGVKKMIVSLWQVPDKETAELMTTFYSYWMKGKTINDAFTQAQADMRKKYSPFYWAAFVLVE